MINYLQSIPKKIFENLCCNSVSNQSRRVIHKLSPFPYSYWLGLTRVEHGTFLNLKVGRIMGLIEAEGGYVL